MCNSLVHLRSLDNFTCEDGWFWCFQADKTWNKRKEYNGREAIALRSRTLNEPFLCKKTLACFQRRTQVMQSEFMRAMMWGLVLRNDLEKRSNRNKKEKSRKKNPQSERISWNRRDSDKIIKCSFWFFCISYSSQLQKLLIHTHFNYPHLCIT